MAKKIKFEGYATDAKTGTRQECAGEVTTTHWTPASKHTDVVRASLENHGLTNPHIQVTDVEG
ncbi:hypothetical protein [Streptomyces sp. PU_AKi4]|uniref:hypothetical protein n=1 Tax=Streptomyces sp. PU_AKi4 TaxID=2800809 RepID=UPI003526148D